MGGLRERALAKPDLELWTGLSREQIKAIRAGKNVSDRFPDKNGVNYLLVMGINPKEEDYTPIRLKGWELLLYKESRAFWQHFKKRNRKGTVQFKTDEGLIIHVHIWTWDNLKVAVERSKRAK